MLSDLQSLLERVESAEGADRDIDIALTAALVSAEEAAIHSHYSVSIYDFTSSVDAALALVERALPGTWYVLAKGRLTDAEPLFACELLRGGTDDEQLSINEGPSLPLAILAALLKALIAKAGES